MNDQILDLDSLAWFAQVVDSGGFSPAARALGVPRQAVHRRVTGLEQTLGLRLLERTTRRVRPTDMGRRLHEHARRILDEARTATEMMAKARGEPTGTLRLSAPHLFGERFLQPVIARFLSRWPETRIVANFSLEPADLLDDDLDLAIRIGRIGDSSLRSRRLGQATAACVASPAYLAAHPAIDRPTDLSRCDTLCYSRPRRSFVWHFARDDEHVAVSVHPRFTAASVALILDSARHGLGVARLPRFVCNEALARGELCEVLQAWQHSVDDIQVVFPGRSDGHPAVRAFVELLVEHFAEAFAVTGT